MPRSNFSMDEDQGLPGQDSFLDIIANIVGILIILVMVVGVRASHYRANLNDRPIQRAEDGSQGLPSEKLHVGASIDDLRTEVEQAKQQLQASQSEIRLVTHRVANLSRESQRQEEQRMHLNIQRMLVEEDMKKRRDRLSATEQNEFDVQRKIQESQIQLDALTREQLALASAPPVVEKLETVSTPLARQVHGEEIHLRLKGGLVSVIPVQLLVDEIYSRLGSIRRSLQERGHVVETFGPMDGYRLRLDFAVTKNPHSFTTHSRFQPPVSHLQKNHVEQKFEFLPTKTRLGENVEQALLPGSKLSYLLSNHTRTATPITVWVYTDSFAEFHLLKRALWEMHFPVAVRPMAMGDTITASPHGTRSAAQ